jgi:hypothetical protein
MSSTRLILIRNSAICRLCLDHIESKYCHDLQTCSCGEISVDGGLDYGRRLAKNMANVIDTSLYKEKDTDKNAKSASSH